MDWRESAWTGGRLGGLEGDWVDWRESGWLEEDWTDWRESGWTGGDGNTTVGMSADN